VAALGIALFACSGPSSTATKPKPPAAAEQPPAPTVVEAPEPASVEGFAAIDLFGTTKITIEDVMAAHRDDLAVMGKRFAGEESNGYGDARAALIAGVENMGDFAHVELSMITYYAPEKATYMTIDVVDAADRSLRMTFDDSPTGDVDDPGGLLAAWGEYEEAGHLLMQAGEIDQSTPCPVFHCVFGFAHPTLAPFAMVLGEGAAQHADALAAVLSDDADPLDRARAAFVLAHLSDGNMVAELMLGAFADPESLVRNNAMRVIAFMAMGDTEVAIPLAPVLAALRYPSTTDRNKASAILSGLARREEHRAAIAAEAGDVLLAMLRLWQPNNHDFAYDILKTISGEDFGERSYDAWQSWLERAPR
jgi:hypothetical protein